MLQCERIERVKDAYMNEVDAAIVRDCMHCHELRCEDMYADCAECESMQEVRLAMLDWIRIAKDAMLDV